MDFVFIEEFRLETLIGIYDWERLRPQTIQLDLEIGLRSSAAASSDSIDDTVDYGLVTEKIRELSQASTFGLIEALGEAITTLILRDFPAAKSVRLKITKLGMMKDVKRVGLSIYREAN
jgi:dihydroneopterin aldolase